MSTRTKPKPLVAGGKRRAKTKAKKNVDPCTLFSPAELKYLKTNIVCKSKSKSKKK